MKSIYLLCSERSGSNLLRTLLGNHEEIHAPIAPHFYDVFYLKQHLYYTPDFDSKGFLDDATAMANHPYHGWKLDENKSKNISDIIEGIDFLYEQSAPEGSNFYCSKGIHNFNYASQIITKLPKAKFIYLHRDPRDHAASWLRTPLFLHTPFDIIKKWVKEQEICISLLKLYPNHIIKISYEEIIDDPQKAMTTILNFLNAPIDENCFSTNPKNTKQSDSNPFWKNLGKPIMRDNKKKFLTALKQGDLNLIETLAKDVMEFLGYTEFESKMDWAPSKSFKLMNLIRRYKSKSKSKKYKSKKMQGLSDKFALQASLLSKRKEIFASKNMK